jgi:hypothetical protein
MTEYQVSCPAWQVLAHPQQVVRLERVRFTSSGNHPNQGVVQKPWAMGTLAIEQFHHLPMMVGSVAP